MSFVSVVSVVVAVVVDVVIVFVIVVVVGGECFVDAVAVVVLLIISLLLMVAFPLCFEELIAAVRSDINIRQDHLTAVEHYISLKRSIKANGGTRADWAPPPLKAVAGARKTTKAGRRRWNQQVLNTSSERLCGLNRQVLNTSSESVCC